MEFSTPMDPERTIDSALAETSSNIETNEERPNKRKRPEVEETSECDEGSELLDLCTMDEKKRFMIRQINAIRKHNPEAFTRTLDFSQDPMSELTEAQLRTVLTVLREESGISGPYDNAQSIISFFGNLAERKFGLDGAAELLTTDADIVSLVHEYLPSRFQNLGGMAKLAEKILDIVSVIYSKKKGIRKPWLTQVEPTIVPEPIVNPTPLTESTKANSTSNSDTGKPKKS